MRRKRDCIIFHLTRSNPREVISYLRKKNTIRRWDQKQRTKVERTFRSWMGAESKRLRNGQILMVHRKLQGCHFAALPAGPHPVESNEEAGDDRERSVPRSARHPTFPTSRSVNARQESKGARHDGERRGGAGR